MAKKTYIGVNNVAREVKKMYIGVNGIAKKVTKAYIGDENGKARLVYSAMAGDGNYYHFEPYEWPYGVDAIEIWPDDGYNIDTPADGKALSGTKVYISVMTSYNYSVSITRYDGADMTESIPIYNDETYPYFIMPTYDVYVNITVDIPTYSIWYTDNSDYFYIDPIIYSAHPGQEVTVYWGADNGDFTNPPQWNVSGDSVESWVDDDHNLIFIMPQSDVDVELLDG